MNSKIITVDGPSGVGKGTIAMMIAESLGFKYLDSGSLYRSLALKLFEKNQNFDEVLSNLDYWMSDILIDFKYAKGQKSKIFVNGEDFTDKIRTEKVAMLASKIAINKSARDMLEKYQRSYIKDPGLVADGRDMGTKVFSEAKIKFFLTASVEKRAERRLNQLKDQGISANLRNLIQKLLLRDKADMERTISPLIPAEDAIIIDTSDITASEVFNTAIKIIRENLKII
ncbi:MAG: (d)CMP kinase [Gammaproteobacteria bacterium]|nr:(d)CMP kinase [Gammaproteobacteria bacterium]MBT7603168.1 (d)CMP kinase [Gammaproteobacteria bacterium]